MVHTKHCLDVLKFYKACTKYVVSKLPLKNVVLKNLPCLHPLLRSKENSMQMVSSVIENIPILSSSTDLKKKIVQEWRKYKEENITEDFYVSEREV